MSASSGRRGESAARRETEKRQDGQDERDGERLDLKEDGERDARRGDFGDGRADEDDPPQQDIDAERREAEGDQHARNQGVAHEGNGNQIRHLYNP